jgi:hypothetical protein
MFLGFMYFDGLILELGNPVALGLTVLTVICFICVFLINSAAKKKLSAETKFAPISIAKKIYGNDSENLYYCIYAEGDKRHDQAFIERIAEKISAIPSNTSDATEKQVNNLFRPDFAKPNEFGKTLPTAFTEGVKVWRKQFGLGTLDKTKQQKIEDTNQEFLVVIINPENAKILHEDLR